MSKVDTPIDVSPWFDEARAFSLNLAKKLPLVSAVLDDWNVGELKGPRIIYGTPITKDCSIDCVDCALCWAVGMDEPAGTVVKLRTTLCEASEDHLRLLPAKQRFLNCKTLEQYAEAFVVFLIHRCQTEAMIHAELEWIKGFRLLFVAGTDDLTQLLIQEKRIKDQMLWAIQRQLADLGDTARLIIVQRHAQNIGLF